MSTTPRFLDDGTETPADDELVDSSRFTTLYSLRSNDDGRLAVVAFDRYGRRIYDHPLRGLFFSTPHEAFDAIRRVDSGSGEHSVVKATDVAPSINAEAAARSA